MEPVCRGMGSCGICLRIYGNRSPKIQGIIHDMLYFNGLVHNVCAQADRADNRQDSVYVAAVGRNSLYSRGGAVRNRKQKKIFSHGIPYFRGHRQPAAGGMRVGLCIINEQQGLKTERKDGFFNKKAAKNMRFRCFFLL